MFITVLNKNENTCVINAECIQKCSIKATVHENKIDIYSTFVDKKGKTYKTRGYVVFIENYIAHALNVDVNDMLYYKEEIEDTLNCRLNAYMADLLNGYRVTRYSENFDENLFLNTIKSLREVKMRDEVSIRNNYF